MKSKKDRNKLLESENEDENQNYNKFIKDIDVTILTEDNFEDDAVIVKWKPIKQNTENPKKKSNSMNSKFYRFFVFLTNLKL